MLSSFAPITQQKCSSSTGVQPVTGQEHQQLLCHRQDLPWGSSRYDAPWSLWEHPAWFRHDGNYNRGIGGGCIDWDLSIIDSKVIALGITIGEESSLEYFVWRKTYFWHNLNRIKSRLFNFCKIILWVTVEFQNTIFNERTILVTPDFGQAIRTLGVVLILTWVRLTDESGYPVCLFHQYTKQPSPCY